MSRRTHYIPVGNLVLDGVSIDPEIYCPANGYPDPTAPETLAQYCPAGGYYDPKEPLPYIPDEEYMPSRTPVEGEVVMLLSPELNPSASISTLCANGATYKIYGANETLLDTLNMPSGLATFDISNYAAYESGGYHTLMIVVTSTTGSDPITRCVPVIDNVLEYRSFVNTFTSLYRLAYGLLQLKLVQINGVGNSITTAAEMLYNSNVIHVEMPDSMNSCTTLQNFARNTPYLTYCKLPTSLPEVTNVTNAFNACGTCYLEIPSLPKATINTNTGLFTSSKAKSIKFVGTDYTAATSFRDLVYNNINLEVFEMPEIMPPNVTSVYRIVGNCTKLKKLVFPAYMNNVTDFAHAASYTRSLRELTMPLEANACMSMSYMLYNSSLPKLVFNTAVPLLQTMAYFASNSLLQEITFATSFPALTDLSNAFICNIKTISFPDFNTVTIGLSAAFSPATYLESITFANADGLVTLGAVGVVALQQINITGNNPTGQFDLRIGNALSLTSLNLPGLKCSYLSLSHNLGGIGTLPLTSVNIDWANSSFDSVSSPVINLARNSLSTSELNRIFGLLPTVSGKTFDARYNPGSASCDPTIAEAKGWTVLR